MAFAAACAPAGNDHARDSGTAQDSLARLQGDSARGLALMNNFRDSLPDHSGNTLRCTSCHLDGGLRATSMPWIGSNQTYPRYRGRSATTETMALRINDCIARSLAGKMLPDTSRDMRDMLAYLASIGNVNRPAGVDTITLAGNVVSGERGYTSSCARCHGAVGEGTTIAPAAWGIDSYSIGAGLARQKMLATFLRHNMPFDMPGTLSTQEAADIAAYVLSQPRQDYPGKERDWPKGDPPGDAAYATDAARAAGKPLPRERPVLPRRVAPGHHAMVHPAAATAQQLDWKQAAIAPRLEKIVSKTEPDEWNTIAGLVTDQSGRLYVLDNQEQQIKVFSIDGKLLRRLGRKGQGPGEFQSASRMQILRDSIWVFDARSNRVTAFDLVSGRFRTMPLTETRGVSNVSLWSFSSRGQWLMSETGSGSGFGFAAPTEQRQIRLSHRTPEQEGATIVSVERPRSLMLLLKTDNLAVSQPFGRGYASQPLSSSPLWAVAHDGNTLFHLDRRPAAKSTQGEVVLKAFAQTGAARWTRALVYTPRPISKTDMDRLVDSIAAPRSTPGNIVIAPDRVALLDSMERPPYWPPVTGLLPGIDGSIWLLEGGRTQQTYYWRLSPAGVPELRVVLPASHRILLASRDFVWITHTDTDGMTVLGRYRVGQASSGGRTGR